MGAEVTDVVRAAGRVTGVVAQTADGELRVDAAFTVAADGRHSTVRDRLRLHADENVASPSTCCGCACHDRRHHFPTRSPTSAPRPWW